MPVTTTYGLTNIKSEFIDAYSRGVGGVQSNNGTPSVIALADGGFALSYLFNSIPSPGDYALLLDRYTSTGVQRLSASTFGISYLDTFQANATLSDPDSAQLSDGRILTTWTKAGSGIHYAIVDPVNGNVTVADTLLPGTDTFDFISDVAGLRTGGGFVMVKQDNLSATDQDADINFYNSAGVLQLARSLGSNSSFDEQAPSVAVLTNGNVVAAYEKELADGSDTFGMTIEMFTPAGAVVLAPFNFDVTGLQNRHPQVLAQSGGGFVIAYEDSQYGSPGLSIAFFTAAGGLRSIQRADPDGFADGSPNVSELANGFIVVTWTDNGVDAATSMFDPVTMTRLGGSVLTRIEDQGGQQEAVSSAALANGTFVTAWTDYNDAIADGNTDPNGSHVSIQIDAWARTSTSDGAGDTMTGDGLIDIMIGNGGNDIMNGNGGADIMRGGLDSDTYYVDNAGDVTDETTGGGGTGDYVFSTATFTAAAGIERLYLQGTGNINATGRALQNDILVGNSGNNVINGLSGNDLMRGGLGNDTYYVDSISDTTDEVTGGGGAGDFVYSAVTFTASQGIERLYLTGSAAINGTGRDAQNDVLGGNSAANVLSGRTGNDVLIGGLGNDTLTGGAGLDIFRFDTGLNAATNMDTITDFAPVDDTIQLENAIFTALTVTGILAAAAFNTGAAATQADDRIIYNTVTGALLYDADGLGGVAGVQFALLSTHPVGVSAADFLVY